jgi:hypothetical protein
MPIDWPERPSPPLRDTNLFLTARGYVRDYEAAPDRLRAHYERIMPGRYHAAKSALADIDGFGGGNTRALTMRILDRLRGPIGEAAE